MVGLGQQPTVRRGPLSSILWPCQPFPAFAVEHFETQCMAQRAQKSGWRIQGKRCFKPRSAEREIDRRPESGRPASGHRTRPERFSDTSLARGHTRPAHCSIRSCELIATSTPNNDRLRRGTTRHTLLRESAPRPVRQRWDWYERLGKHELRSNLTDQAGTQIQRLQPARPPRLTFCRRPVH